MRPVDSYAFMFTVTLYTTNQAKCILTRIFNINQGVHQKFHLPKLCLMKARKKYYEQFLEIAQGALFLQALLWLWAPLAGPCEIKF